MRLVLDLQACQAGNRQRGIGRYALSLGTHIARLANAHGRSHDVRILLNNRFPDTVDAIRQDFDGLVAREHIHVFSAPAGLAGADPANAWRMLAAERIRENVLADLRPDVVHVGSLFEGWGDDAVSSVRNGTYADDQTAVTLFDLIPLMRPEMYLQNAQMRSWYHRKLQSLKSAELLLAISGYSRDEAISALHLPPERVINISSAIDPHFGPVTLSDDARATLQQRHGLTRPFLMYTGGIDHRKNIEGLIDAFARLPLPTRQAHQLAIVCNVSAADRKRLGNYATAAGLARDALVLTGYVPDSDLIALYNLATAFVFPSLHEGFGLPALEAMSCGTPVIGSDASSIPEVIGRADALFDPTDIGAMSSKIQQVLTDEHFRTSLRSHGLAQAREFSWEASAERALAGFEQLHAARTPPPALGTRQIGTPARPRLAFLSPLPPDKSGIADYSADLIAELLPDYDIEVIVQAPIDHPVVIANCKLRSIAWFEQHAIEFDRIVYHFGNSAFHEHMFGLLSRYPGVVVLHDFYLSGIINHLDHTGFAPDALNKSLYDSHGYPALIAQQRDGRLASIWGYPCNRQVLDDASGVIVHSAYARQLAKEWYGPDVADDWVIMPFPRALAQPNRQAARKRLGLDEDMYVVCTFGMVGSTKLNDRLLAAWLDTPMARDPLCRLVFVGANDPGTYGEQLTRMIDASSACDRITVTGYAPRALYLDYLAAADSAVQLRGKSRGETSAAIMDCLAFGVPTIVNANGSAAEVPDSAVLKLADDFNLEMLSAALVQLRNEPGTARTYSGQGRNFLATQHHPHAIGRKYRDVIEQFSTASEAANRRRLMRSVGRMEAPVGPSHQDWAAVAQSLVCNRSRAFGPKQLLVDVSELVQRDSKSGIQRVVKNVLHSLLKECPEGFRVEPVYEKEGQYWYARNFTCAMLDIVEPALQDTLVEVRAGDRYLGLDLLPHGVPRTRHIFVDFKNRGVEVYFVVYDLLPVLRPDVFVAEADFFFKKWLDAVSSVADGIVCISRAVADELAQWLAQFPPERVTPLRIDYFHLGADIPTRASAEPAPAHAVLGAMQRAPSILMVGTIEPRKGHAQALAAFEMLWKKGSAAQLVIVGKSGWMVDAVTSALRKHPEQGKRLFWLDSASDALLLQIYQNASALLAASVGEGFGLPLIEAAQYGVPIIARDLPVFMEVAQEHASYFSGTAPGDLANALEQWLVLQASDKAPSSAAMPWLTWSGSARQLVGVLNKAEWYLSIGPARARHGQLPSAH